MADQFYDDIPALANQITNDIDQMEKSLGFIKDVFQNFLVSFSNTDATVAFPANMELDPTPGSDHLSFGIKTQLVAGENVAFGDVCYLKSDGKLWIIDADAAASMPGIAMADATIAADATGYFLLLGFARDDTWAWTVGGDIFGTVTGTTGNTLSQTAPSGSGDQVSNSCR
jgi:hypothetical protein